MYFAVVIIELLRLARGDLEGDNCICVSRGVRNLLQQRFQLILMGAGIATEQEQQLEIASGKILVAKSQ